MAAKAPHTSAGPVPTEASTRPSDGARAAETLKEPLYATAALLQETTDPESHPLPPDAAGTEPAVAVVAAPQLRDGRQLEIVLRRAAKKGFSYLPPAIGCEIATELLSALVPRVALNTQNTVVGFDGKTRLVDVGQAPLWLYSSPEHIQKRPLDARSDTFVVGMLLFRMLCGKFPFPGAPAEVEQAIVAGRFPTPVAVNPQLSLELSALLTRALDPDPARRFSSAAELGAAVRQELARDEPPLAGPTVAAFMLWLFEEDLEKEGIRQRPTEGQRALFERWSKETQPVDLAGDTFKAMEARTALETMPPPPPSRVPWVVAAVVAAALVAAFLALT